MLSITKYNGTANMNSCSRTPEYIVIHYTAGTNSSLGHAKSTADLFNNPSTKASADFIVDDGSIIQYNSDPKKKYCWAVGGSKYPSMSSSEGGKYYGKATNSNCISIEICSNKKSTKTLNATDTDWYFSDASINNAVGLCKYLMGLYNITTSKVIMHNGVTGKICPNPWCVNENALSGWRTFQSRISGSNTSSSSISYMINGVDYKFVFDPTYYAQKNSDLAKSGITTQASLFNHFITNGMKESRQAISTFNVVAYKAKNPDLQKAFGNDIVKYYVHYCTNGHNEANRVHV